MPPGGMGMPPGGAFGMPPGGVPGMPMGGGMPPGAFGGNPALVGQPAEFPNAAQPSKEPQSPFSMKDDGAPNAFNSDPYPYRPMRLQMSFGYSLLWFRPGNYPTLATTGSIADQIPGALDQPGTRILSGGTRDPGPSASFRSTFTYWLRDPEILSLNAEFFLMEQRSLFNTLESDINGSPILMRPFFNPAILAEEADQRSLPAVSRATLTDSVRTRLMGADANLKWHSSVHAEGAHFAIFGGMRWLRLDERYNSFDTRTDISGVGQVITYSDTFTTYNQFFGAQFGANYRYTLGRFSLDLGAKLALGPNYQTIKINGHTDITIIGGGSVSNSGQGLYAQPSNVGNYRAISFSMVSQADAKLNFDITERLRFQVGYSFLLLNRAVRPGEQMDRTINTQQQVLLPGLIEPNLPGPPSFRQSSFYAHMLNFGLEFNY
ncbi:MAG: hypothetical protein EXR98_13505 [Gemmataceae bacterium]|nr:hypothetical protein [Gemmataceae bacterium]